MEDAARGVGWLCVWFELKQSVPGGGVVWEERAQATNTTVVLVFILFFVFGFWCVVC